MLTIPSSAIRSSLRRPGQMSQALGARASTIPAARLFSSTSLLDKEKLVILGSGWAGYNTARKVDKDLYDVTVVSPNNYFSFTPFLASACVGTLEFRATTEAVRKLKHVNYAQGWADKIDLSNKTVHVSPSLPPYEDGNMTSPKDLKFTTGAEILPNYTPSDAYQVAYDKLIIATGSRSQSFGTPGVMEHANFLKDVREARAIRHRLLQCLEMAYEPSLSEKERADILKFNIVGGGPTGVEFAAELHDFVHQDVRKNYPGIADKIEIRLFDVAPGILMSFDAHLRAYAEKKYARDGIKIMPNSKIVKVDKHAITLDNGERYPFGLLVWSTGVQANEFVESLKTLEKNKKTKAITVNDHLQVIDSASSTVIPNVWAIGDNCTPSAGPLPATAQVASQMATYMAKSLNKIATGTPVEETVPFKWKNKGSMVFIGDERAMVDRSGSSSFRTKAAGWLAWIIWRSYYASLALSPRNKILVPVYWVLAKCFGRDIVNF